MGKEITDEVMERAYRELEASPCETCGRCDKPNPVNPRITYCDSCMQFVDGELTATNYSK